MGLYIIAFTSLTKAKISMYHQSGPLGSVDIQNMVFGSMGSF